MHCTNLNDVNAWWQVLNKKDIVIQRYGNTDINDVCSFDYTTVLKENLEEWMSGKDHVTFWHLKQLIINLKNSKVKIPVVATRLDGNLFVDPGGSRITVLKHLKKKTVDVDVVYPRDKLHELDIGDYKTIETVQEFLEPYENIGIGYKMDVCYDKTCVTCKKNNVIHNGDYRYSISWSKPWFYDQDYHEWYAKNKNYKTSNLMDWYSI